jgi:hypothetical protein
MRKLLTLLLLSIVSFTYGQKDTSWTNGGSLGLNGSQTSFTNWAKGGENQVSVSGNITLFSKYLKGKNSWDNLLIANLGTSRQGKQDYRKGDDQLEINSIYGHQASKNWYYSVLFNFKTQFASGYDYPNDSTVTFTSKFMAPANIKLGIGFDYKPNKDLSLFLSPSTARITIVNDQDLADAGKFGLLPAEIDANGKIIHADKYRMAFGAMARLIYAKDIFKNVRFATILELYSDYLNHPLNVDVDWQFLFTFKVNDFLNAQLKGQLIYDDDVNIDIDSNNDGIIDAVGPRVQFTETLSLGLVYKL